MALKMAMTQRGFDFAEAHIEIISVTISKERSEVNVGYQVFANRAAAVADARNNVLSTAVHSLTFAEMGAPLATFYAELQAKLLEQFPTAVAATDAF